MTTQTVTLAKQGVLTHFSSHPHGGGLNIVWLTLLSKPCSITGIYMHPMNSTNNFYFSSQEIPIFYRMQKFLPMFK
jgi:hypothetical protein